MKHTWKENTLPPELNNEGYSHIEHVKNISFCIVTDKALLARMCRPYRYLIQVNGTQSKAFVTKEAFSTWIKERGLRIKRGYKRSYNLIGSYLNIMHCDSYENLVQELGLPNSFILNNGGYTDAWVIKKDVPEVHYINPNYRRKLYDYRKAESFLL